MRSDLLRRHMATHNEKIMCRYCKREVREDLLLKHEVFCKDKVDEKDCYRSIGVHQHTEDDPDCSSVVGFFNTYTLNVSVSSDHDEILNETCNAVKERIL